MAAILLVHGVTIYISHGAQTQWQHMVLDNVLFALIFAPFVWFLVLRPLQQAHLLENKKAQAIIDTATEGIATLDEHGVILSFNSTCERIFGHKTSEVLGRNVQVLIPDLDEDLIQNHLATGKALGFGAANVFVATHKNGTDFPIQLSASEVQTETGRLYGVFIHDISAHIAVEEALMKSNELLERIFSNLQPSIAYLDAEFNFLRVNRAYAESDHREPDYFIGKNHFALYPNAENEAIFRRVVETGEAFHATAKPFEFPAHPEWGLTYWDWGLYPLKNTQGEVDSLLLSLINVTEQQQVLAIDALLHALDEIAVSGAERSQVFELVSERLTQLFGLPLAWVGTKQADGTVDILALRGSSQDCALELRQQGVRWDDSPIGRGPTGVAIRTGKRQIFGTPSSLPHPWREAAERHGLESGAALPILLRGEVYGALSLYSDKPGHFDDPALLRRIEGVISHMGLALEMALDQHKIRLLGGALAAASNAVFIADRNGRIEWANDAFCRLSGYPMREVLGQSPRILKSGQHDAAYYKALWSSILEGRTWYSETIERHKSGKLYTVKQTITPIRDASGEVSHFITIHEDITAQKMTEERIQRMAHYDALTDLPNRNLFYDRLQQAMQMAKREGQQLALLFLDLDHFKQVNDTLGHAVGDLLLQASAARLEGCVRESDTVARLAGDEFTVILPKVAQREDAARVAEKIIHAIDTPFDLEGHDVRIGTSIGIAFYPSDAEGVDDLVKRADEAMYVAKSESRNTYRFYRRAD